MYQNWIERSDLQRNARSDRYYLFGDNLRRVGMGGQAKSMRGEPNAIGIATKNGPSMHINDMWVERTPADAKRFISLLEADLEQAEDLLEAHKEIVIPTDGLGTGFSKLPENAPITNEWLTNLLFTDWPKSYGTHVSSNYQDHLPSPFGANRILIVTSPVFRPHTSWKSSTICGTVIAVQGRAVIEYSNRELLTGDLDEWTHDPFPTSVGFWVGEAYNHPYKCDTGGVQIKNWRPATISDFQNMDVAVPDVYIKQP